MRRWMLGLLGLMLLGCGPQVFAPQVDLQLACREVGCFESGRLAVPARIRDLQWSTSLPGGFRVRKDGAEWSYTYLGTDGPVGPAHVAVRQAGTEAWTEIPVSWRFVRTGTSAPAKLRFLPGVATATVVVRAGDRALRLDRLTTTSTAFDVQPDRLQVPAGGARLIRVHRRGGGGHTQAELRMEAEPGGPVRVVPIQATDRNEPDLHLVPSPWDLGPVSVRTGTVVPGTLHNRGGAVGFISNWVFRPAPGSRDVQVQAGPVTVPPLDRKQVDLVLRPRIPGPFSGLLVGWGGDSEVQVWVSGTGVRAELWTPDRVRFDPTVLGHSSRVQIPLVNTGNGALRIDRVQPIWGGSGGAIAWDPVPALPRILAGGDTLLLPVRFTPPFVGAFEWEVRVDHTPGETASIHLSGTGVTCAQQCPLPGATPACEPECAVASCLEGHHDADGEVHNGCECRDPEPEPRASCSEATDGGVVHEGRRRTVEGVLHPEDSDWFRWVAADGNTLWNEGFDLRIALQAQDPSLRLCVATAEGQVPAGPCYGGEPVCGRTFHLPGRSFVDDTTTVWVRVDGATARTCAGYVVTVRNGG